MDVERSLADIERQARWEMLGAQRGVERYRSIAAERDPATLPAGQQLLREIVSPLTELIRGAQTAALEAVGADGRRPLWTFPVQLLPADQQALITTTVCCRAIAQIPGSDETLLSMASEIARGARLQVEFERWVESQRGEKRADDSELLIRFRHRYPHPDPRTWRKWAKEVDAARESWPARTALTYGSHMIGLLLEAAPGRFERVTLRHGATTTAFLYPSDATRELVRDTNARAELARPFLYPMVCPPNPWVFDMGYTGGYITHREDFVRRGRHGHTAALEAPVSAPDVAAANRLGATAWRINDSILDVLKVALDPARSGPLGGIERLRLQEVPERSFSDEEWESMTEDQRQRHSAARLETHKHNVSAEGIARAWLDCVVVASEMVNQPAIWYPHNRCFRGRLYPIPSAGPNPQGSDVSKSLLMFAGGLPLGDTGEYWLCVRAANCAGQDKLPLDERAAWAYQHMEDICASAADPLNCTWWSDVAVKDEPWGLLATCFELAEAWALDNPSGFVSHLPVPLDGSCNGLQHLSALALDPVGGAATNLLPGPRQDIYSDVAELVSARVLSDASRGVDAAIQWRGHITRATVKRAVMTTPYGVTARGIRAQLISEKVLPPGSGGQAGPLADYLTRVLTEALGAVIQRGRSVMEWLQAVAKRLADAGLPFDWTTPTGSHIRQAYYKVSSSRLKTLVAEFVMEEEVIGGVLLPKKQAAGAAPNFIHSYDGSHLALTVNASFDWGVRSFAMIHDSYGTHAANTGLMGDCLRQEFAGMYARDWLAETYRQVLAYAPHVDIPEPPKRGTLDISKVLESEFFFS